MKKIVSTLSLLTFLALSAQADDMMIELAGLAGLAVTDITFG